MKTECEVCGRRVIPGITESGTLECYRLGYERLKAELAVERTRRKGVEEELGAVLRGKDELAERLWAVLGQPKATGAGSKSLSRAVDAAIAAVRVRLIDSPDWIEDCQRYIGYRLTGEKAHWCRDWDLLPVDETTQEFLSCTCFKHLLPTALSPAEGQPPEGEK